jgi:hypothetical protein
MKRLYTVGTVENAAVQRALTRVWTRVKSGR